MPEMHPHDAEVLMPSFESVRTLEKPNPRPDKEIIKEVIAVHVPDLGIAHAPKGAQEVTLSPHEEEVVSGLVNRAVTAGIRKAVAEALNTHRPEIIEALHDRLVDLMYEKLVAAGRIDPS